MTTDPRSERRPGIPARRVLWALLIVTVVLVGGFFVAYRLLVHYDRVAARHVPAAAVWAARLDLQDVVLFEPVRRHLLPLLEQGPKRSTGRLAKLQQATGFVAGKDLREIVVAGGPDGSWDLAMGGTLPAYGLIEGIHKVLNDEGWAVTLENGRLHWPILGWVMGQASDGALVLASNREWFERAIVATEAYATLGLEREGPGSLAALPSAWSRAVASGPAANAVAGASLERVRGSLHLGERIDVRLRLDCRDAASAKRLANGLKEARQASALLGAVAGGGSVFEVVRRAELGEPAGATVPLSASYSREELDRALEAVAAWVRRQRDPARKWPN